MRKRIICKAKKAISLAVILVTVACLTLSTLPLFNFVVSADGLNVWDGTNANSLSGSGTKENPYLISNGSDLRHMFWRTTTDQKDVETYYKLTADIYLNDVTKENWKELNPNKWPINQYSRLNGGIDGDGHTIYGLYIDTDKTGWAIGLVGSLTDNSHIKNLSIKDSYISATGALNLVGAFAGDHYAKEKESGVVYTVAFENCFIDETVTIKGSASGDKYNCFTGGFIGGGAGEYNSTTQYYKQSFTNCYYIGDENTLTAISGSKCFPFSGAYNGYITLNKCYSISNVKPIHTGRITDVYGTVAYTGNNGEAITVLNSDEMKGINAKTNMPDLTWDTVWQITDSYPTLVKFGKWIDVWDGSTNTQPEGEGTKEKPYLIANGENLRWMYWSSNGNDNEVYYKLTADIYINNVNDANWKDKNPNSLGLYQYSRLNGGLDGDGHTIYGLYINTDKTYWSIGLFGYLCNNSYIKNLSIKESYISATGAGNYVGAFAGSHTARKGITSGTVTFENCFIDETVIVKGSTAGTAYTGGFIGAGKDSGATNTDWQIKFTNCYYRGSADTLSGLGKCFPFTGAYNGYVALTDCYSISNVKPIHTGRITDVYATVGYTGVNGQAITVLTADQMKGVNADDNMPNFDWTKDWETTDTYPELRVFTGNVVDDGSGDDGDDGDDTNTEDPADAAGVIWDGTSIREPKGSGTEGDPYLITNGAHLRWLYWKSTTDAMNSNLYYKLTDDIYLNDVSKSDWKENPNIWSQNQWSKLKGGINGDGHTIYGLYINADDKEYWNIGLVGGLANDTYVKNLHIRDAYISATGRGNSVGAFAGAHLNAQGTDGTTYMLNLENCSIDESVTIKSGKYAGGFVGSGKDNGSSTQDYQISFTNCYYRGTEDTLIGNEKEYFLFTGAYGGCVYLNDCYFVGPSDIKPIHSGTVINTYGTNDMTGKNGEAVTVLSSDKMQGLQVKQTMSKLDWEKIWIANENDYPTLAVIPDGYVSNSNPFDEGVKGRVWSGKTAKNFAGGNGTKENPFLIETPEQLAKLVSLSLSTSFSTIDKYYKLTEDIYLNDTTKENWQETATQWYHANQHWLTFNGHFDGDGHIVSGIYVNRHDNTHLVAGLFPCVSFNAVIENVGVVNCEINVSTDKNHAQAAAIAGYIFEWQYTEWNGKPIKYPYFSQCFGDTTVSIKAQSDAGGIVGGMGKPVIIENCYFVGTVEGGKYDGSMIGHSWYNAGLVEITTSYARTTGRDDFVDGSRGKDASTDMVLNTNCYNDGKTLPGVTYLTLPKMQGKNAVENMQGFDFENVWMMVDGGTPVLKIFGDDAFSENRDPADTVINFVTNGGNKLEPIHGKVDTPIKLPIPEREHYTFAGWYVYDILDIEFPLDTYPSFDMTLYAKWTTDAIIQDFEAYPNTEYDLEEDYVHYKPGVLGYSAKNVRGGSKALKRIGNTDNESDFLVSYEQSLEVGKEYELIFYVNTDKNNANTIISLVHATWPDVYEPNDGVEKVTTLKNLESGNWKEVKYKFIAKTRWISIRTTGGNTLYFDDIIVVPTGKVSKSSIIGKVLGGLSPMTRDKTPLAFYTLITAAYLLVVVKNPNKSEFFIAETA